MTRQASMFAVLLATGFTVAGLSAQAQQLSQPVYRVANEQPAAGTAAVAAPAVPATVFDLTQRPGEHPLAPCVRLAEEGRARLENEVADYTCTFTKYERIDGKLEGPQIMSMRVIHKPFGIYMKFLKPYAGREVLYVDGQNKNQLVALSDGWKRNIGKVFLDPNGSMAMDGQRHPITKAGLLNLTTELVQIAKHDMQFDECTVRNYPDVKIDGRPTTMIEAVHPIPRSDFKFHVARIYIDNELKIPTMFEAYSWPRQQGGEPVLEEKYIYTKLQLNTGLKPEDFSVNNPAIFK